MIDAKRFFGPEVGLVTIPQKYFPEELGVLDFVLDS